jgi:hypothetical protein
VTRELSLINFSGLFYNTGLDDDRIEGDQAPFEHSAAVVKSSKFAIICVSDEYLASDTCLREFERLKTFKIRYMVVVVGESSYINLDAHRTSTNSLLYCESYPTLHSNNKHAGLKHCDWRTLPVGILADDAIQIARLEHQTSSFVTMSCL